MVTGCAETLPRLAAISLYFLFALGFFWLVVGSLNRSHPLSFQSKMCSVTWAILFWPRPAVLCSNT